MRGTERCRNQNGSSIQVDQPTSGEKVESMLSGGCARGGNKTKEDVKQKVFFFFFFFFFFLNQQFITRCSSAVRGYIIQYALPSKGGVWHLRDACQITTGRSVRRTEGRPPVRSNDLRESAKHPALSTVSIHHKPPPKRGLIQSPQTASCTPPVSPSLCRTVSVHHKGPVKGLNTRRGPPTACPTSHLLLGQRAAPPPQCGSHPSGGGKSNTQSFNEQNSRTSICEKGGSRSSGRVARGQTRRIWSLVWRGRGGHQHEVGSPG